MNADEKQNWDFPISIPTNPIKKFLKNSIGKIAQILIPGLREKLFNGQVPNNKFERAALTSIFIELEDQKQLPKLAELHKKLWSSNANQGYYDFTSGRLRNMFEELKESLYGSILNQTNAHNIEELVELGCGEGVVVNRLSEKFPEISSFVGIDINNAQIETNKATFAGNKKLRFQSGDLAKDLESVMGPNKIYLTFGGVLEYLTEQELMSLFTELSVLKNTVVLLYEPIEPGFDVKEEQHSKLYGAEFSFCHPYHHYLTKLGYEIADERHVVSHNSSWIYLAARIN